jgi:hypothetical protein
MKSFLSLVSLFLLPLMCTAGDHTFIGMWRPDLKSTLARAESHPEFKEEDRAKMEKMLPQFIGPLRMQLTGSEILMKHGSRREQTAPYEVVSSSEDELVILLRPTEVDEPLEARMTRIEGDQVELRIEGNHDLDMVVWVPADSMEAEDLNLAAVVAGAMGTSGNETSDAPAAPARSVSPEKAIENNLRIIETAAMQYMLEHGVNTVTFAELEGDYFKSIPSINGEEYKDLTLTSGMKTISVTDKDGKVHARDVRL